MLRSSFLLSAASGGSSLGAMVAVGVVIVVGIVLMHWFSHRRQSQEREALFGWALQHGMVLTAEPLGFAASDLAGVFALTPAGERRSGVEDGVEGDVLVRVAGEDVVCRFAMFMWWSEVMGSAGEGQRWERRWSSTVMVRLPRTVDGRVVLQPGSLAVRSGLVRPGDQVESDQFNRRFRLETSDRTLGVVLFDASMQQLMVERFPHRGVEIVGEVLLLSGVTPGMGSGLPGFAGFLDGLQQDASVLLDAIPPAFWREAERSR